MNLAELDYMAILVATIAGYAGGAVWFAPAVFGDAWLNALNKDKEDLGSPTQAMVVTFFTTLAAAFVLALVFQAVNIEHPGEAIGYALLLGIGFYAATMLSDYFFCDWGLRLFAIQCGYRVTMFVLMAIILVTLGG